MASLLSRYKGCLIGAAVGDCIGAVFEASAQVAQSDVLKLAAAIEQDFVGKKLPKSRIFYTFTDDTAMARSVAASLISCRGLDLPDMAKRFAKEYKAEPFRGYGGAVTRIFPLLEDPDIPDLFGPAKEQFDGQGSYGNGGAMRISPAGVFCHSQKYDFPKLKEVCSQITQLTHSHIEAINGSILESLAISTALSLDAAKPPDADAFLNALLTHIRPMEEEQLKASKENSPPLTRQRMRRESDTKELPYTFKLEKMKDFMKRDDVDVTEVEQILGNDISALGSVPAAVYSYLRASRDIPGMEDRNAFERTVLYAISLGGDTDTIATMAAAIAGAHYGTTAIPESWRASCEGTEDASRFGQQFYDMRV